MKVIRFTATWCAPCKMVAEALNNLETNVPVEVIDIDENEELARSYNIRSVPTLVKLDEDGNEVDRLVGMKPVNVLKEWFNG